MNKPTFLSRKQHGRYFIESWYCNGMEAIIKISSFTPWTIDVIYIRKGGKLIETATGQGAFTWAMNFISTAKLETNF